MNDLVALWQIFLDMPRDFHILMGTVFLLSMWAVWYTVFRKASGKHDYDLFIKYIDDELGAVRKLKRADRPAMYAITLSRVKSRLSMATGPVTDFYWMETWQQSVWIYLLTRERNILWSSANRIPVRK